MSYLIKKSCFGEYHCLRLVLTDITISKILKRASSIDSVSRSAQVTFLPTLVDTFRTDMVYIDFSGDDSGACISASTISWNNS